MVVDNKVGIMVKMVVIVTAVVVAPTVIVFCIIYLIKIFSSGKASEVITLKCPSKTDTHLWQKI